MDSSKKRARAGTAAADLTDDLIVEILSRLPVKSICRFKCVSRHWHGLISHPEHRKNIPQTISGFFYPHYLLNQEKEEITAIPDFIGIRGTEEPPFLDPSLPFLPGYRWIRPKDCCGGFLLNMCWKLNPRDECNYVVCNPAAEKWMVLPEPLDNNSPVSAMRLGFDPAVSSHFHVFRILEEDQYGYVTGLEIYSSETGAWSHKENGWSDEVVPVGERERPVSSLLLYTRAARCSLYFSGSGSTSTLDPSCESSREDAGQAVGRRGGGASPGDGAREAPQGHHRTPARRQQRRGRGSRSGDLQADAVDAVDPDDAGDAVDPDDDHAEGRQQRVAQRVPPGEQPGHQGHGRQPLRPPAAKLPHRLRLALQRRDQEQPPLDRTEIG